MNLVIGGAYQGKLDFARDAFGHDKKVFICTPETDRPDEAADIISAFHLLVLSLLRRGTDPCRWLENEMRGFAGKTILCDDISCGVVPVDAEARAWREAAGRCLGMLARNADTVTRVFCGIGTRLK